MYSRLADGLTSGQIPDAGFSIETRRGCTSAGCVDRCANYLVTGLHQKPLSAGHWIPDARPICSGRQQNSPSSIKLRDIDPIFLTNQTDEARGSTEQTCHTQPMHFSACRIPGLIQNLNERCKRCKPFALIHCVESLGHAIGFQACLRKASLTFREYKQYRNDNECDLRDRN